VNIVGHRGASVAEPENTPEAFATADRMGADGVELDVRSAPDGHGAERLVVFHNPLPDDQDALDAMPSFDDVLQACGERMLINVEIKNSVDDGGFDPTMSMVAPIIEAMRRHDGDRLDRWLISSFSIETVDHCRLVAPEFATAHLVEVLTDEVIQTAADRGHRAVHPWHGLLDAERVAAAHDAGLAVNVWTCNEPARLIELGDMGVDGVCTDVPDVARTALGRVADDVAQPTWNLRTD
jgi:glycerophosphoryl diester phosphodiesterase